MLTLLSLLLITQLADGNLQCPKTAASFGDDFDLSSFYVQIEDGVNDEVIGVVDGGSASGGGSCKFIYRVPKRVVYLYI